MDKTRGLRGPGKSGITIVISPLIALMKDQVDALKRRGIAADCIDSTKTLDQLQTISQQLASGSLQIIYCSPERLNNERFVDQMKHIAGGVRLVAVDEAHCISEVRRLSALAVLAVSSQADATIVGAFLSARISQGLVSHFHGSGVVTLTKIVLVARFVEEIKAECVICLTATATARVADDVCKAFQIDDQVGVFRTIPYRPK